MAEKHASLKDVAHHESGELLDALILVHLALDEVGELNVSEQDAGHDPSGLTDRRSRVVALLHMARTKVAATVKAFDPYI